MLEPYFRVHFRGILIEIFWNFDSSLLSEYMKYWASHKYINSFK